MATQNTESAVNNIQSLFNPQGNQDAIKMMASMNERMTAIFVAAGTRSVEIMSKTAKEALSNLSEATQVRDDPSEYAKVYSDFAQKQMDLMTRAAQNVGEVTQQAGTETKELASEAGEDMSDKIAANAKEATDKITSAAKDATDKATANVKNAADKAGSAAKKSA
ncbi:phasin family protein [Roseovarius arcticus]|uniref:phasin family protein n=1 Tax=Roseovarius arcticus TaxID=2547404 RepID=UPI001110F8BA|nr:phasin family protein [Roseovarius arcticus]